MRYLLDTDMCVDYLRGRAPVAARIDEDALASGTSVVTAAELLDGTARSDDPMANRRAVRRIYRRLGLVPFDWDVAAAFGRIKADLYGRGELIPDFDLAVAATAEAHSLVLVTANVSHFGRIAGLQMENWRE